MKFSTKVAYAAGFAAASFITPLAWTTPVWAQGDFYLNPEYNAGWSGTDFGGGILEAHLGYEHGPWYLQGGPAFLMPDGDDAETGFTAKTGVSLPITDQLSAYGEVSIGVFDDVDNTYGAKVGAKYVF